MSGVKGSCGGGIVQKQGGGDCGQVTVPTPCEPVNPCQNVTPAPVPCKEIVDPCQDNKPGDHHHHHHHHHHPHGGQVNLGGGTKK